MAAPSLLGSKVNNIAVSPHSTNSVSHTNSSGSDRIIIAMTIAFDSTTSDRECTGIRYDTGGDNVAMTEFLDVDEGASNTNLRIQGFHLLDTDHPTTGSKNVEATFNGTVNRSAIIVFQIQDAAQAAPTPTNSDNTITNDSSPQISLTTSVDDSLVLDFLGTNDSSILGVSPDAGQVETVSVDVLSQTGFHSQKAVATAGSTTFGWSGLDSTADGIYFIFAIPPGIIQVEPDIVSGGGSVSNPTITGSGSANLAVNLLSSPGSVFNVGSFIQGLAVNTVTGSGSVFNPTISASGSVTISPTTVTGSGQVRSLGKIDEGTFIRVEAGTGTFTKIADATATFTKVT